MRSRFASQVLATLLVPALFASGAAQALVVRCDASVMSCCTKKADASAATLTGQAHKCCPEASAPASNEQAQKTATPPVPVSVLVASAGPVIGVVPRVARQRAQGPALGPPPAPSLRLADRSVP